MSNCPKEHMEQVTFVREFEKRWPDVRIFAIPNGGIRDKTTARKMQLEGLRPGVPDLFVPAWHTWVEMKREKGGRVSPEQKDWHRYLESCGDRVIIGKGWKHAIEQIESIAKDN